MRCSCVKAMVSYVQVLGDVRRKDFLLTGQDLGQNQGQGETATTTIVGLIKCYYIYFPSLGG